MLTKIFLGPSLVYTVALKSFTIHFEETNIAA